MSHAKPFVVDAIKERSHALSYLRFPEMIEVFHNIRREKPLSEKVLSEWDPETLEGHIRQFILPILMDMGAIQKDPSKSCGFSSPYNDIVFENLSWSQLAALAAKRAMHIGSTIEPTDSKEEMLSANLFFHQLPDTLRSELMGSLRAVLTKYLQDIPNDFTEGQPFRLALVARAHKQ
jgi:hypothetical protein